MRTLILMRHAQAAPAAIDGTDHERALTDSGRRDVLRAAQQLRAMPTSPRQVLVSPALRTTQTAGILRSAFQFDASSFETVDALYLATPSVLRQAIALHANDSAVLLVIGHNPGISELAARLLHETAEFSLPTAGLCSIELPIAAWAELGACP